MLISAVVELSDSEDEEIVKPETTKAKENEPPKPATSAPAGAGSTTPKDKIRREWYQDSTHVVVTIFAKDIPKDKAIVNFDEHTLHISFPVSDGSTYTHDIKLSRAIAPSGSNPSFFKTKLEIKLQKAESRHWSGLESTSDSTPTTSDIKIPDATSPPPTTTSPPPKPTGPAYPTSSRRGPKNWDKVAAEELKPAEGDADLDDFDSGDPAQGFFKKLYSGADPDTQRAMMKSYLESNGTALSTNWAEVSKGPVETSPPEGMEARQWGKD